MSLWEFSIQPERGPAQMLAARRARSSMPSFRVEDQLFNSTILNINEMHVCCFHHAHHSTIWHYEMSWNRRHKIGLWEMSVASTTLPICIQKFLICSSLSSLFCPVKPFRLFRQVELYRCTVSTFEGLMAPCWEIAAQNFCEPKAKVVKIGEGKVWMLWIM